MIIITKNGYDTLTEKLAHLVNNDLVEASELLEETRPIGVSDEFPPEYMQALDNQNRIEKKILDIRTVLSDCVIFNKTMIKDGIIGFGATVKLYDCNNDKEIVYTIVSSYESDISKGLISAQAPLVKEMLNLTVGESFEYNNIEYEILDIRYEM